MAPSMVRKSATAHDANAKKRRRTSIGGTILFFDLIKLDQITGLSVYILSDLIKLYRPLANTSQAPLFNTPLPSKRKTQTPGWEKSHTRAYYHQRQRDSKTATLTVMRRKPDCLTGDNTKTVTKQTPRNKETEMAQVKRTRRQKDQVLLTSLLALCLGYAFAREAKASDCDEFDIDIDAACQSMSVSYSPACDTSYIGTSSSSYCPGTDYGSGGYGSNYGSGCSTGYGSGSGYSSGCNTNYGSNYNSNYGNGASQQNFGRSPIVGNLNNVQNYSTYNSLYNAGYGQNTNMGRPGGYRDGASGESAEFMRTIRTPLIQGAPNGAPNQCPAQGQAPAIGDGSQPTGVTYGQGYYNPEFPASHVNNVPLTMGGIEGKCMVNSAVQPYLRPPTQNEGCDPGMLDTPPDFHQAPATVTNICPQGGIQGEAPTQRWGGQTTRDYGTSVKCKKEINSTNDFGQRLIDKPDLYAMPQCAQDGPRASYGATDNSSLRRAPNRPMAQTTTDRQGNRTFFKGPNYRSLSTHANY